MQYVNKVKILSQYLMLYYDNCNAIETTLSLAAILNFWKSETGVPRLHAIFPFANISSIFFNVTSFAYKFDWEIKH